MNRAFGPIVVVMVLVAIAAACRRPESRQARGSEFSSNEPVLTPGTPTPAALTRLLGVDVEAAPGEVNQFLLRAPQGSVDLAKVGTIHQDLGYAVGVTLANGTQIGFRYEPPAEPTEKPPVVEEKRP